MTGFAYQLYSSRNFPPVADQLSRLAALGYTGVEGFGGLFDATPPDRLAPMLRDAGLAMRSSHLALELIEDDPQAALAMARTLGLEQVYVPYLDAAQRPADADGWRAFGARLARAGAPLRDAGLAFGWHNHDFEFQALPNGDLPIDLILDADLSLEFDVAWAAVAGHDPLKVIARHGDRITAAHVKDRAPEGQNADEDGWADVGSGTLDWAACLAALTDAGCDHFVVEHDNPSDDQRFAARSLAYLTSL